MLYNIYIYNNEIVINTPIFFNLLIIAQLKITMR